MRSNWAPVFGLYLDLLCAFFFSILTNLLFRQNSTWSLNWSIASNSKEKDQWPLAIARTSMKIINLFTIPHRIKYQKNAEEENCKKAADQSPIEDIKVDDSKFSTTKV